MAPEILTPVQSEEIGVEEGSGHGGRERLGGDGHGGSRPWSVPARAYRTGMWMGLVGITMLFAAFTSAMVVRQGISNDWAHTTLPRLLWLNTAILLASSATLELSKRALGSGDARRFMAWLDVTAALGVAFIAGQLLAWKELRARGVYLATNPSSSFFYLLTAAHGVHLLGGITALLYLVVRARRVLAEPGLRPQAPMESGEARSGLSTPVEVAALYWHFMDGLWVYILILMMTRL
jgi:cytochrome c oxidase subunit III